MVYLTLTRLVIAFAVKTLSQFIRQPKRSQREKALRVVRYVKRKPSLGTLMSSRKTNTLTAYCNANCASCPNTRKSVIGFIIKYGESLKFWKSKKMKHNVKKLCRGRIHKHSMDNG